jgi:hypothetical protein
VTLDGPALVKEETEYLTKSLSGMLSGQTIVDSFGFRFTGNPPKDPDKRLAAAVADATPDFKRLFGREPKCLPVSIPISLAATDKTQQQAALCYWVVVEVPTDGILENVRDLAARQEKARLDAQKRVEDAKKVRDAQLAPTAAAAQPVPANTDQRLRQLEKRLADMEDQIRLLIKITGAKAEGPPAAGGSAPAPRP